MDDFDTAQLLEAIIRLGSTFKRSTKVVIRQYRAIDNTDAAQQMIATFLNYQTIRALKGDANQSAFVCTLINIVQSERVTQDEMHYLMYLPSVVAQINRTYTDHSSP